MSNKYSAVDDDGNPVEGAEEISQLVDDAIEQLVANKHLGDDPVAITEDMKRNGELKGQYENTLGDVPTVDPDEGEEGEVTGDTAEDDKKSDPSQGSGIAVPGTATSQTSKNDPESIDKLIDITVEQSQYATEEEAEQAKKEWQRLADGGLPRNL